MTIHFFFSLKLKYKQFPTSATKISSKEEERKDESPASWRLGLRKTGSYGALAEITASKEAQKEKDTAGVMRSASSPRLSSSLDNKEKVIYFMIWFLQKLMICFPGTSDLLDLLLCIVRSMYQFNSPILMNYMLIQMYLL